MKFFYVYYKSGAISRCMQKDLESAYKFYSDLDLISKISFIKEIDY